jgi:hypothetical protein
MASLSQTMLENLRAERSMALLKDNFLRLSYLDCEIAKLEAQIIDADNNERARKDFGL